MAENPTFVYLLYLASLGPSIIYVSSTGHVNHFHTFSSMQIRVQIF